ncbi:MAG: redoxin domain-containing protein [Pirellulales bacterium]
MSSFRITCSVLSVVLFGYFSLFCGSILSGTASAQQNNHPAIQRETNLEDDHSPLGRQIKSFRLLDFRGKEYSLESFKHNPILVVAFLGTECPLVKLYGPRLDKLAEELEAEGVGFVGINANSQDSITEIAAFAHRHGIRFPLLKDLGNQVADQMGAVRTPEVFVLDKNRVIRYRGRIDDQYGVGYVRKTPEQHHLKNAIEELLAGKSVSRPIDPAVGCIIGRVREPDPNALVTYSNQIARVLQKHCVECHREGEIAPFELTEYEEVAGWADMIEEVVNQQRMPPWFASPEHGHFGNNRRMSEKEKQLVYDWVEAGAPEGNPADLPEPRSWVTGWQLPRAPDFVAPVSAKPYEVVAEGTVAYKYFFVDPGFKEDKWVRAIEIQPGNREVVHHILMFSGASKNIEEDIRRKFRGGTGGYDSAYVPGQRFQPYPEGAAKLFPAGSKLVFQVHYTPIGTAQQDQSRVGMVFADPSEVKYEVRTSSAVNSAIRIPAFDSNYRAEAGSSRLPPHAHLLSLLPHMHLRGKSFFYEAVYPGGKREVLLDVPQYDFNWQLAYRLQDPLELPANTRIHCVAHYNNSATNLANPDPSKTVRWGDQTWEEMFIGYFNYMIPVGSDPQEDQNTTQARVTALFDNLDNNLDDRLTPDEVPKRFRFLFGPLDVNGDGVLNFEEVKALKKFWQ